MLFPPFGLKWKKYDIYITIRNRLKSFNRFSICGTIDFWKRLCPVTKFVESTSFSENRISQENRLQMNHLPMSADFHNINVNVPAILYHFLLNSLYFSFIILEIVARNDPTDCNNCDKSICSVINCIEYTDRYMPSRHDSKILVDGQLAL